MFLREFINTHHYTQGYEINTPSSDLLSYIDFIHYPKFQSFYEERNIRELCFPSIGFNLLFPVNGGYNIIINNTKYYINAPTLVPRNTSLITCQNTKNVVLGFKCVLNLINPVNITDVVKAGKAIALNQILHKELLKDLTKTETVDEKISEVQKVLLKLIDDNWKKNYNAVYVTDAIKLMANCMEDKIHIRELSKELFISSKSLTRYFIQYCGLTPKRVFKTLRFRKALKQYLSESKNFDIERFGYFDLSHFYKEVKCFTGLYPNEISKMAQPQPTGLSFQVQKTTI